MRFWNRLLTKAPALAAAPSARLSRPAGCLRAALVAVALSLPAASHAASVLLFQQKLSNGFEVGLKVDNYASYADFTDGIIASTGFAHTELYGPGYSMLGLSADPTGGYHLVQQKLSNGFEVGLKVDNYASYADFTDGIIASTGFALTELYGPGYSMVGLSADPTGGYHLVQQKLSNGFEVGLKVDNYASYADFTDGIVASTGFALTELYGPGYSMIGLSADPTGGYHLVQQKLSNGFEVGLKVDSYASYADFTDGIVASTGFAHTELYGPGYSMLGLTFDLASGGTEPGSSGGVPEPASWALMLLGFGAVGLALRAARGQHAPVVSRRLSFNA